MAAYVLATVFCFQRGSAESKDPDSRDEVDEDPRRSINTSRRPPGRCARGTRAHALCPFPLHDASSYCSCCPWLAHAVSGTSHYNAEQRLHGQAPVSMRQYLGTARFWFESFQNWQSEFLAVGTVVVLSIWLRERGSPESKPVHSVVAL